MTKALSAVALFALLLTLVPFDPPRVEARPGGGHSYSGGRGGGGGSSGSSGTSSSRSSGSSSSRSSTSSSGASGQSISTPWSATDTVAALIFVFLFGVVGLAFAAHLASQLVERFRRRRQGYSDNWQSRPPPTSTSEQWQNVRRADPDFSLVLFDDFVYALYAAGHRARHDPQALAGLGPYLDPKVRAELHARPPQGARVEAVVIGATRVVRLYAPLGSREHQVTVEFEANLTARAADGPRGEYVRERWIFSRAVTTRTRPWTGARTFPCPACGAPFVSSADERCGSCGQVVGQGRFDWRVLFAAVHESSERPPVLTGTVEEHGTDRPTARDAALAAQLEGLSADDPGFSEVALRARAERIFRELHAAWAAQDLRPVRPHASDALFHYLQYWVDAYRAQGLLNAVEGARIVGWEPARVVRDRHYDAVTARIWATGHEVTTEKATGRLVGGSRQQERAYSEYWTFIRGAAVRGAPRMDPTCPSCGAPLAINMAGSCEHCGVHVTSGEFDWVLSRIEQDDSYSG